ncbi:hypothetical protein ACFC26_08030 [Kitasatospora purpeofusca]|uniref:hypothetical protein n=1 Tax=Kitasatospora purpeofusca TaxID=67352 RepID=UPI0035D9C7D1
MGSISSADLAGAATLVTLMLAGAPAFFKKIAEAIESFGVIPEAIRKLRRPPKS